jgi:hypothetical protein
MGSHNVVIACRPAGSLNRALEARVVAQKQCMFTCVRIGLLISFGSGVPNEADNLVLGDMVVSMPSGYTGGINPYRCNNPLPDLHATAAIGSGSGSSIAKFVCLRFLN